MIPNFIRDFMLTFKSKHLSSYTDTFTTSCSHECWNICSLHPHAHIVIHILVVVVVVVPVWNKYCYPGWRAHMRAWINIITCVRVVQQGLRSSGSAFWFVSHCVTTSLRDGYCTIYAQHNDNLFASYWEHKITIMTDSHPYHTPHNEKHADLRLVTQFVNTPKEERSSSLGHWSYWRRIYKWSLLCYV